MYSRPRTTSTGSERFTVGDKGSKDKGKREKQNKAKVSLKEKRKLKQEKNKPRATALTAPPKRR